MTDASSTERRERADAGLFQSALHRRLRRLALRIAHTPLHPQWVSFVAKRRSESRVAASVAGMLLDVGCGDSSLRRRVAHDCHYVALDFPLTGQQLYGSSPDVFADAALLPFANASFDGALLLDVLEHVRLPEQVLGEIARVLRPAGVFRLTVPFLYPLHDEPHDYQRFTAHGLRQRLVTAGFERIAIEPLGAPPETAALLANIAMAKIVLRWSRAFAPLAVLWIPLIPVVLLTNICGRALSLLTRGDHFMPVSYFAECRKPAP